MISLITSNINSVQDFNSLYYRTAIPYSAVGVRGQCAYCLPAVTGFSLLYCSLKPHQLKCAVRWKAAGPSLLTGCLQVSGAVPGGGLAGASTLLVPMLTETFWFVDWCRLHHYCAVSTTVI